MDSPKTLRQHCEEIAAALKTQGFSASFPSLEGGGSGFAFDPISIVTILLPMFASCFSRTNNGENPKDFLEACHDEVEGYSQSLIDDSRRQTRTAAMRELGRKKARRLTQGQLDSITVTSFDHIRNQSEEDIQQACQDCRLLPRQTQMILD